MQVTKINTFFRKVGVLQIKFRVPILIALFAITILCCIGIPKLNMESNEREWFEAWDQVKINQDYFEEVFGNDDSIMVLVQAENVFAPEVLDAIERLGNRLEREVPYADRVISLMNVEISKGTEDSLDIENPFKDGIPKDEKTFKEKKDFILSRESLVNNLVSDDGTETWVILSLEPYTDITLEQAETIVGKKAESIILSEEFKSDLYTLKPAGMSYTEMEESEALAKETKIRILSGFALMILCLILLLRSIRGLVVPLISTVAGIGSVFGLMGHLGITGDSSMVTLPIMLGMALSVGYSIHYINSFKMHLRIVGNRKEAVLNSIEETGWPILFTVITTVASLISFIIAGIKPLKWVGAAASCVVLAVYFFVIILIPILMSFGKNKLPDIKTESGATKTDLIFEKFGKLILKNKKQVIIFSTLFLLAMIPGIFRIKVNMDYTEVMGKKIPYVDRLIQILKAKLGSQYSYDIMIEFEDSEEFKSVKNINALEELEKYAGTLSMTKISDTKPRVTSICNIIKEMNRAFNADKQEYYSIPQSEEVLSQLIEFCGIMQPKEVESWLDAEYRTTHIHVELKGYDANKIVENITQARIKAEELFPEAKSSIVGIVAMYADMNEKIVKGELKSFSGSFLIIAILLIVAFSSIKTGLIGMIPNISPVIILGGFMGYFNLSLDMITMTIMPMILGIAVDDTIHFTNHVKYHTEKMDNIDTAILKSFREIGKTMGMTTFILCGMFFMYMFSPVNSLFRIGLLAIIGLFSALVADYTLTPALLSISKPFKNR